MVDTFVEIDETSVGARHDEAPRHVPRRGIAQHERVGFATNRGRVLPKNGVGKRVVGRNRGRVKRVKNDVGQSR